MVVNWNDAADARVRLPPKLSEALLNIRQLFAAVIATSDLKFDYNKIAAIMGPGKHSLIRWALYIVN